RLRADGRRDRSRRVARALRRRGAGRGGGAGGRPRAGVGLPGERWRPPGAGCGPPGSRRPTRSGVASIRRRSRGRSPAEGRLPGGVVRGLASAACGVPPGACRGVPPGAQRGVPPTVGVERGSVRVWARPLETPAGPARAGTEPVRVGIDAPARLRPVPAEGAGPAVGGRRAGRVRRSRVPRTGAADRRGGARGTLRAHRLRPGTPPPSRRWGRGGRGAWGRRQPLRGAGKAVGRGSSRRAGLPAVGWVGMERAAGTDGTPAPTLTVRVPDGSAVCSADSAGAA